MKGTRLYPMEHFEGSPLHISGITQITRRRFARHAQLLASGYATWPLAVVTVQFPHFMHLATVIADGAILMGPSCAAATIAYKEHVIY
jgi:hypothetical protein